jgi:CRP-like cAMP-binding protein
LLLPGLFGAVALLSVWNGAHLLANAVLHHLIAFLMCLQKALSKLLLFDRLEPAAQAKVVEHTWMRSVAAGEILIQEGETGLAATELYVVKSGTFEVGQNAS